MLFAPNDGNESAGSAGAPETTPEGKDSDPNGGKDRGGNETVPYGRFKEVNDENKSLKAKLAEFESAKAKAEAEKKQQEEAEALKKGEHEKIIAEKQAALDTYKSKEDEWSKRTASVQAMVDAKYKDIQTKYGDEVLTKVKTAIGSEDPWVVLERFDAVMAVSELGTQRPQGGQQQPAGGGQSTYDALKKKLDNGESLTPKEEKAYFEALSNL